MTFGIMLSGVSTKTKTKPVAAGIKSQSSRKRAGVFPGGLDNQKQANTEHKNERGK